MRWTTTTILLVQVLARFSCVATVLEARRDALSPDDATSTAAATAGGTGRVMQLKATESDVKAAARHCVAVDEDGRFPANHALGLFETERGRLVPGTPRVTDASVEFSTSPRRQNARGSNSDETPATGTIGIKVVLEVDNTGRWREGGGGTTSGRRTGEPVPTREDVEMAAAAAIAATAEDPAEAQMAISVLAAWNLITTGETPATLPMIRVEVGAAFGYHGDWYTAGKTIPLTSDSSCLSSALLSSATFDWQPAPDVWSKLDEPMAADVRVYGTASTATEEQEEGLLLLRGTLCKRASGFGGRSTHDETTQGTVKAALTPYAERLPAVAAEAVAISPSRPSVVVSEIRDGEWWRAREEEESGRGMDAVDALPRLPRWKPGDWKKRRRRRKRQEEEREKQRAQEAARRRADSWGDGKGRDTASRDGRNRRGSGSEAKVGKSPWGAVKGAWRAVGRGWRRARRKFRRNCSGA
ncbi:unnamed protein product [Ectocarpus sp. 12 AP-2014]